MRGHWVVGWAALFAAVPWAAAAQDSSDRPAVEPSGRDYLTYDLRARGWFADLRGDVRGDDDGVTGTDFDVGDDLGLDDRDIGWGVGLLVRAAPRFRVYTDFWRAQWDSTEMLLVPITFDATPYAPGNIASLEVTLNRLAVFAGYEFTWGDPDGLEMKLIPLLGVNVLDARVTLSDRTIGFTNYSRLRSVAPLAGGVLQFRTGDWLTLEARAWGMRAQNVFSTDAAFVHLAAEAQVHLIRGVYVFAGWEYDKLEFDNAPEGGETMRIDFQVDGPYFGVGWRF